MSKYLNGSKLERAKAVISAERIFEADSVEARALILGKKAGHSGDALLDFVYKTIGGAFIAEAVHAPLEAGVISSVKEGKETTVLPTPTGRRKIA